MPRKKIEVTPINTRLEVVATCTVAQLADGRIAILREAQMGEEWGSIDSMLSEAAKYEDIGLSVVSAVRIAMPKPRKRRKKTDTGMVNP